MEPTPIYDLVTTALLGTLDAISRLAAAIRDLQPGVETAREASRLAEEDSTITDAAFDVIDGEYTRIRRQMEALEEMRTQAQSCLDALSSCADTARVAGV